MSRCVRRYAALLGLVVVTGCGGGEVAAPPATSGTATSSATTAPTRTTAPTATTTPKPTTSKPTTSKRPATSTRTAARATRPPAPAKPTCTVPSGVTARQVVVVRSSGSSATVRACRRSASGYQLELGPYSGHVGVNGVSWSKREGDGATPGGTYPLRGGFGARANPGLAQGWFRVDANDVWVDDSASGLYNTHQRKPAGGRWTSAENLLNTPAYSYAQVIGYNEARTPGKGSAIFLHVDKGGGTAGCVSLPTSALLAVMRWERAGAVISIR